MPSEQTPSNDPLDLSAIDRDIRMNELTEQARELGMGDSFVDENCPADVHEGFLKSTIAFESAPVSSRLAQLVEAGIELPAPESLDGAALHAKLWEVINALAARDAFLSRTNHLSDRELYAHLWSGSLREEEAIMPPGSGWVCHIDILGGCSEEDLQNSLRYYDSEEDRQRWAKDFPDDVIPPHEDPPYDRDRLLPRDCDERDEGDVDFEG